MAEGRVLRKKISVDERVAQLSDNSALLFTWAISHADVEGRIEGSAVALKATVVPLRDWPIGLVGDLADEWTRTTGTDGRHLPLAERYDVDGKTVIQFTGWAKNFSGRKDRESASTLPKPPKTPAKPPSSRSSPGVLPDDSGTTPARGVLRGVELSRGEGRTPPLPQAARDHLWDELAEHLGTPRTKTERGKRNTAIKQLRDANVTAEEVQTMIRNYPNVFPRAAMTDIALAKHCALLLNGRQPAGKGLTPQQILEMTRGAA